MTSNTPRSQEVVGDRVCLIDLDVSVIGGASNDVLLTRYEILLDDMVIRQNTATRNSLSVYNISHSIEYAQIWDAGQYSVIIYYTANGIERIRHEEPFVLFVIEPITQAGLPMSGTLLNPALPPGAVVEIAAGGSHTRAIKNDGIESGSLPPGLSLSAQGAISGTPFTLTIKGQRILQGTLQGI